MNTKNMRIDATLKRVRDFGATRTGDFPAASLGGQMFAEVTAVVAELAHFATIQYAGAAGSRAGKAAKARLRKTLREDLRAINRTARGISVDRPEVKNKFRLPPAGDQRLLTAARTFAEEAEPLAAEFAKHEIAADFIVKPKRDIDAFEAAVTEQNRSIETRVQATATLEALLARGAKAMQHLDPIVRNKYLNDEPSQTAWESASHVERHNARAKDDTAPGDPTNDLSKTKASGVTAAG